MTSSRFLFSNGAISHSLDTPSVSTLLESHPGAYTTTRTLNNSSSLLFWQRHLQRLCNSATILYTSNPLLFFKSRKHISDFSSLSLPPPPPMWDSVLKALVNDSMTEILPVALNERNAGEELAITALVSGDLDKLREFENISDDRVAELLNVSVHIGIYVPPIFGAKGNGARLALVGLGRDYAEAKYSEWVRLRKPLEKFRPPLVTELLLSDDGDHILEGCVTNFFVVCRKVSDENLKCSACMPKLLEHDFNYKFGYFKLATNLIGYDCETCFQDNYEVEGEYFIDDKSTCPFEVQTAPVRAGVLPGIIRQLVFEVCLSNGITVQEVAPSWSKRELWQEAFITNSLRIVQHVEKIQVPTSWEPMELKTLKDISWEEKQFGEDPGMITKIIQKGIIEKAGLEEYKF